MWGAIKHWLAPYAAAFNLAMVLVGAATVATLSLRVHSLKGEVSEARASVEAAQAKLTEAKALVAAQSASIEAMKLAGDAQADRIRAAEQLASTLARKPLPAAPQGCVPAAAWARSDETRSRVLESW